MNKEKYRLVFGLCLALISSAKGTSQYSDTLVLLEEVQIVTDRVGLTESRTGRSVTVIQPEEIRSMPVNSIDELLRYIPFIEVQSRGPFGAQSDILIRGSTFNQVLVLVDGMRVNEPLTGHFNGNLPVPIPEISRIEIYRGGASAEHGPDAVGGVVNIITKSFDTQNGDREGLEGQLGVWYGKYGLLRAVSGLNFSTGKWSAGAGFCYNASAGHPLDPDSLRGDFDVKTASVSIRGEPSERVSLGLRIAYDARLFNARYFYTASPLDVSREQILRWMNQARLRFRLNESQILTLSLSYQSTRDSFLFNPVFPANVHRTHFQNCQLNHLFIGGNGLRLASGFQLDNRWIFSSDRGNRSRIHTGGYLILSREFDSKLSVGTGFRLDYDRAYGLEALPQINVSYTPGKWTFRGSAGRSIRSPDFTENYVSTGLPGLLAPGRNLGNPDLVAERFWNLEGGIGLKITPGFKAMLTGFSRFSRDLIDYVLTAAENIPGNEHLVPGAEYLYARNIGLLKTGGLEVGLEGRHFLHGAWALDWRLAYQILSSRTDSVLVSKYLSSHARNLVQGGVGLHSEHFRVQVTSMYKDRTPETSWQINQSLSASYMLWNIRLDKYLLRNRLQFSLQVNNLLDEDYSDFLGAKMPGRWILGGITLNLAESARFTDNNPRFTD